MGLDNKNIRASNDIYGKYKRRINEALILRIVKMRHGSPPDFDAAPLMTQQEIATQLGII